ncbi:MAG: lyase family protein, partial [Gammaproteobacteria bacterium]
MKSETNHLWGGRFSEPTDEFVKIFGASVSFDKVLALYDIEGSIAHATMLSEVDVLTSIELKRIIEGLEKVKDEIINGQFSWSIELEDVHMNIESRLTEICGDPGKKLHTGRSRNDQVATDIRLYLRDQVRLITKELERLLNALLDLAEQEIET